jgi:bidirectional [NiFe] hydrogenase diaphorase subunit
MENTMITLSIDGTELKAQKGECLLWVALDNGFYIPNLCAMRGTEPPMTSCRLCFVEVEGKDSPVTSCSQTVFDGMKVHLNTNRVKRIRNTAFELLLSNHSIDCAHCDKNGNCGLQEIASKLSLKLKVKRFRELPRNMPVDTSHPLFYYDPNKCVLCGRCIQICHLKGSGILDFAYRGLNTIVSTFSGIPLAEVGCDSCLECVEVCPVGSLVKKG